MRKGRHNHMSVGMRRGKKLSLRSFPLFQGMLFALLGVVAGLFYAFGGLIVDVFVSVGWIKAGKISTSGIGVGTGLAFFALLGMPIVFFCAGYIVGCMEAILYNYCARFFWHNRKISLLSKEHRTPQREKNRREHGRK